MKILGIAKNLFQRSVFCKRLTYVTLICNQKAGISTYLENTRLKYLIYLQVTLKLSRHKIKTKHFLQISGIAQKILVII